MARRRFQNPTPKREGAWWYLRVWEDAIQDGNLVRKLKRIKLAEATVGERQAKKLAAEIVRPINQGLVTVGAGVNFAEYVQTTYLPTVLPYRPKSVQRSYRAMLNKYILPALRQKNLAEITPFCAHSLLSDLYKRGVPYPTIVKVRDAFSHVVRSTFKFKYLAVNPLEGLDLPPDNRQRTDKPFISPPQFEALLELMPEPYGSMVYVSVWTGVRVSELLALKWRNLHVDSISVQQKYCRGDWGDTKTRASAATIPISNGVVDRIQRLKTLTVDVRAGRATRHYKVVKKDGPDDLIFQSVKDGKPMNDGNVLSRFIKPAAAKLNLVGVNWQCLRRSCATWLVQAGADMKSVQGQMRHARSSTTMEIYAQFVPEGQRRAVEQMVDYARKAVTESGTKPVTLAVQ